MESVNKTNKSNGFKLSVLTLAIMNITAVVSLRGLATEAIYGLQSAFYYLFAALVFLIPTAMVAAELAAMFANREQAPLPLRYRQPEPLQRDGEPYDWQPGRYAQARPDGHRYPRIHRSQ